MKANMDQDELLSLLNEGKKPEKKTYNEFYLKVAYFVSLAGTSILVGFSYSINKFRKNHTGPDREAVALAKKALLRGTIYSVSFCGILGAVIYRILRKEPTKIDK